MITGDQKETAIAVAKELDIIPENADIAKTCFTGSEFEELSAKQKQDILSGSSGKVFSRVEPRHKRELVKILIEKVSCNIWGHVRHLLVVNTRKPLEEILTDNAAFQIYRERLLP